MLSPSLFFGHLQQIADLGDLAAGLGIVGLYGLIADLVQTEGLRRRNMATLRIKLVKSLNGRLDSHIATAKSLGLHRIGNETLQPDNPQTRGKIAKIGYLLQVTEE